MPAEIEMFVEDPAVKRVRDVGCTIGVVRHIRIVLNKDTGRDRIRKLPGENDRAQMFNGRHGGDRSHRGTRYHRLKGVNRSYGVVSHADFSDRREFWNTFRVIEQKMLRELTREAPDVLADLRWMEGEAAKKLKQKQEQQFATAGGKKPDRSHAEWLSKRAGGCVGGVSCDGRWVSY